MRSQRRFFTVVTNDTIPTTPNTAVYVISKNLATAQKWCDEHQKFADVARAWEKGEIIQFRQYDGTWSDVLDNCPTWDIEVEYRVKPGLLWTDLRVGDVIRRKSDCYEYIIPIMNMGKSIDYHVYVDDRWISDDELGTDWEKVIAADTGKQEEVEE